MFKNILFIIPLLFFSLGQHAVAGTLIDARASRTGTVIQSNFSVAVDATEVEMSTLFNNPELLVSLIPGIQLKAIETTEQGHRVYIDMTDCLWLFCESSAQTYHVYFSPEKSLLQARMEVADIFIGGAFSLQYKGNGNSTKITMQSSQEADFSLSPLISNTILTYKVSSLAKQFLNNIEKSIKGN
jgi:hypothetical protein